MLFGRLTERAQRVLAHAQEEAIRLNHSNIGTEHLLLGLMKEPDWCIALHTSCEKSYRIING